MKKTLPLLILVIAIAALAYYFSQSVNPKGTSVKAKTDFVIEDTSAIGKIFIADALGNTITLERIEEGYWELNGKYKAREDAVFTLLKTFKNVYIQRPVPKEGQEQVNRVMAGATKKVEVYDRGGKWIKTWYVGHATMDKKGTYMLLETPQGGKASEPYVLDMRGFIGMLNTRFFTNENEWRSTGVINYPNLEIKEVEVFYPGQPENSFRISYGGGNDIALFPFGKDQSVAVFDSSLVKDYLLNFKLASFENYKTGLTPAQVDSVKNLMPYQIIRLTDRRGKREIKLWPKELLNPSAEEEEGDGLDRERVYASVDDGELALAQRFAWDKFRAPFPVFLPKEDV